MFSHEQILAEMIRQFDAGLISFADIARHLSIAPARVTEMKNGTRRLQAAEMPKLAAILGMASPRCTLASVQRGSTIPIWRKVAAGVWMEQTYVEGENQDRVEYDRLEGDGQPEDLFAVRPEGPSMNLTIPPSMILICRRVEFGMTDIRENQLVIVERENHNLREMTCKRLKFAPNGDFLLCNESDRPEYAEPFLIPKSHEDAYVDTGIKIIGVVVRGVVDFRI